RSEQDCGWSAATGLESYPTAGIVVGVEPSGGRTRLKPLLQPRGHAHGFVTRAKATGRESCSTLLRCDAFGIFLPKSAGLRHNRPGVGFNSRCPSWAGPFVTSRSSYTGARHAHDR